MALWEGDVPGKPPHEKGLGEGHGQDEIEAALGASAGVVVALGTRHHLHLQRPHLTGEGSNMAVCVSNRHTH